MKQLELFHCKNCDTLGTNMLCSNCKKIIWNNKPKISNEYITVIKQQIEFLGYSVEMPEDKDYFLLDDLDITFIELDLDDEDIDIQNIYNLYYYKDIDTIEKLSVFLDYLKNKD